MNRKNTFTFADLANSTELKELHQIISDLTGIPMNLADEKFENIKWFSSPSNFNPVCQLIRSTEIGCQRCRATDIVQCKKASREKRGDIFTIAMPDWSILPYR